MDAKRRRLIRRSVVNDDDAHGVDWASTLAIASRSVFAALNVGIITLTSGLATRVLPRLKGAKIDWPWTGQTRVTDSRHE